MEDHGGIQNSWFISWKIPSRNGWMIGAYLYFRKPANLEWPPFFNSWCGTHTHHRCQSSMFAQASEFTGISLYYFHTWIKIVIKSEWWKPFATSDNQPSISPQRAGLISPHLQIRCRRPRQHVTQGLAQMQGTHKKNVLRNTSSQVDLTFVYDLSLCCLGFVCAFFWSSTTVEIWFEDPAPDKDYHHLGPQTRLLSPATMGLRVGLQVLGLQRREEPQTLPTIHLAACSSVGDHLSASCALPLSSPTSLWAAGGYES